MFNITFTCKRLTGDKIHTITIQDSSLNDTWTVFDIGEVDPEIDEMVNTAKALFGNTHDVNVWDNDGVSTLDLYNLYPDEDGEVTTDHSNWVTCEILNIEEVHH